uniref:Uncharacterized protein n=1 Tax=Anguilla anguilla TaxID=7936 RepID=A0A0E9UQY3_ANGAN
MECKPCFHWMIDGEPPSNGPKLDTQMSGEDQEPGSQGTCRSTHTHPIHCAVR